MAAKKKKPAKKKRAGKPSRKPLFEMWQEGMCADNPKQKLYSARVGGGSYYGPVTAPNKTAGKAKLLRIVRKALSR